MAKETAERRLARLRRTHDPAARDGLLTELLTSDAIPIIDGALHHRRAMINPADREDLRAQVLVRLLRRLNSEAESIRNFDDYVATVTYHVVDDYARVKNPAGAMMANRIRYVVRHDARFAAWEVSGETVCGLASWKGEAASSASPFAGEVNASSLLRFFEELGHPVALKDFFARQSNDSVFEFTTEDSGFRRVEMRELLRRLWDEIGTLPQQQRVALLLSIRDSKDTSVLPTLAPLNEIATTIGWEPSALAAIWSELPLEDDRIAAMLNLSRQQVINLRKSARARLTRRMEQW